MKKRILSIFLVLCILLCSVPTYVFSAGAESGSAVTYTAIDGTGGNYGENYTNIFDGKNSGTDFTKWCVQNATVGNPYVVIKASSTVMLKNYTFVTGNDTASHPGRNPKAWTVYGSNDYNESAKTGTWTAVHTVTNGEMPSANFASKSFSVNSNTPYKYFKIVITEIASTENNKLFQLCGIELSGQVSDADVVYTPIDGTENTSNNSQNYDKLIDGNKNTKWCYSSENELYIVMKASSPVAVNGYTFTTGNDTGSAEESNGRNPKTWQLYGCNDYNETDKTGSWVVLHGVLNDTTMEDKDSTDYSFSFENSVEYQYYKLVIKASQNGEMMQLSEMKFSTVENGWYTPTGGKPISLGTGAMLNPVSGKGLWQHVYFGNYDGNPIDFRILQKSTNDFTVRRNVPTLFLENAGYLIYMCWSYGDEGTITRQWKDSLPRQDLNGTFLTEAFKTEEQNVLHKSRKNTRGVLEENSGYTYSETFEDKVFILSFDEYVTRAYGFGGFVSAYNTNIYKKIGPNDYNAEEYYTRTRSNDPNRMVALTGTERVVFDDGHSIYQAARFCPAINIPLSSILFTKNVNGDVNGYGNDDYACDRTKDNIKVFYKLSVLNSALGASVTGNAIKTGNKIKIPYSVTGDGATQLSVMILDKEYKAGNSNGAALKYYAKLADVTSQKSGTAELTLPSEFSSKTPGKDYYIYVTAEDINGEKETDFASAPVLVTPKYTVTYKPGKDGTGSEQTDYKTADTALTLKNSIFSRTNYAQTGWSLTDGGAKAYDLGASYTANSELVLYPVWTRSAYTVTYSAGKDGTGTIAAGTKTRGTNFTLSKNTFTRTGYTQVGWATSDGGAKVYDLGGTYSTDGDITLYPVWSINTYTVNYSAGALTGGQSTASDYMRYIDVEYGGNKYRGVVFDVYRPSYTGSTSTKSNSYQDDNGYTAGDVYWFKYDPITWRVLDPAKGLAVSEMILDSQAYNNYILSYDGERYGDADKENYANSYAESSIRKWLNNDFCNTAFSTSQQNMIVATKLDNSAYSTEYSKYNSTATTDKVYLLAYSDAITGSYGFSSSSGDYDTDRRAQGSDYAKSQGLWVSSSGSSVGKSSWRLRSAGNGSGVASEVGNSGNLNGGCKTDNISSGTRPALSFNTGSDIAQSGRTITEYNVGDTLEFGNYPQTKVTDESVISALNSLAKVDSSDVEKSTSVANGWTSYGYYNAGGYVASAKKTHGTALTLSSDTFKRTGYTQVGWATTDGGAKVYDLGGSYTANADVTLYPVWEINEYTITVKPENGEADITLTQDYNTTVTAPTLTRTGYAFDGWDKTFPKTMPAENMTVTAKWKDITAPTGEIKVGTSGWKTFINNITFGLFFKNTQEVTITATDNSGDDVKIEYLLSNQEQTETALATATFTAYSDKFALAPNNKYVIYAKLTDKTGNVAYINSNGIVFDNIVPVITGITNGETYCSAQTVTVTDDYIDTVKVNENTVELNANGQFTLSPAEDEQKIVATDSAGNKTEMTVTVNDGHTYDWHTENGKYWAECLYCDYVSEKKTVPEITVNGANRVCKTQDYNFTATSSDNTVVMRYGYEFALKGDGGMLMDFENGVYSDTIPSAVLKDDSSFVLVVNGETTDGYVVTVRKNVEILQQHTGGTANCKNKAKCEVCGVEYGNVNPNNHTGEKEWTTKNETQHEQKWRCCGAIAVALENHEWENGVCKDCGAVSDTPITSASFTLDTSTYAVGKKIVDLKVTGTNTGLADIGGANTGYYDGFVIAKDAELNNLISNTSVETFAAGTTYYLGVMLIAADGYTLTGLTKDDVKLNGAVATDLDLYYADTEGVAYFTLPQLSGTLSTPITSVNVTFNGYAVGRKFTDSTVSMSVTPAGSLTSPSGYFSDDESAAWHVIFTDYDLENHWGSSNVPDTDATFKADTTYYLAVCLIPTAGYSLDGLTKENIKLGNTTAIDLVVDSGGAAAVFSLPKLSTASVNFTLDMSTYAVGKKIVDIGVTGANTGLETIGGANTGYYDGFVISKDIEFDNVVAKSSVETFVADTTYYLGIMLTATAGYDLAGLTKDNLKLNGIAATDLLRDGDNRMGVAYFELPQLSSHITSVNVTLNGYAIGRKFTDSTISMSVNPDGALISPDGYLSEDEFTASRHVIATGYDLENHMGSGPSLDTTETFAADTTYYLIVYMKPSDGYDFDGLTKENIKLGNTSAIDLIVDVGVAGAVFELPKLSLNSIYFTLDTSTYAVGKKIVDLKVSGTNYGLADIGGANTGYGYGNGFIVSTDDTDFTNSGVRDPNETFAVGTSYYLGIVLVPQEGYGLLTTASVTLNGTAADSIQVVDTDMGEMGIAYFKLPQLSSCHITSANFTLGGYAVGSKVIESTLSMSVTPAGALVSPAKYVEINDVENGYTTTNYLIGTDFNKSDGSMKPLFKDYEKFESGITYYLDVIMIPATGYDFEGLTKENVKLGNLTAIELVLFEGNMAAAIFELPPLPDYSWYDATKTDYTISNVSELLAFANLVNGTDGKTATNFAGKTVKLENDIDLSGIGNWTPIGMDPDHPFNGTFDGQGNTISNLTVNSDAELVGLFGYVIGEVVEDVDSGSVKNLAVSGSVTAPSRNSSYIGGIVGIIIGSIENCSFSGSVTGNGYSVGGVVGMAIGEISKCSNFASVGGNGYCVGGIVGSAVNVRYCYNQGNIATGRGVAMVGGIAGGIATEGSDASVYSCYSTGTVSATGGDAIVGAVVGTIETTKNRSAIIDKVYYLDSVAEKGVGATAVANGSTVTDNSSGKSSLAFYSGEVAWLLQSAVDDADGLVWGQKGSADGDLPILTDNEDFRVLPVKDGESIVNYSVLHKGDINNDSVVDIYDYQQNVNIALSENNTKTETEKYDLNGDGVFDVLDCDAAQKQGMSDAEYSVLLKKVSDSSLGYFKNADFDDDGVVDVLDIATIEKLLAGHRVKIAGNVNTANSNVAGGN